MLKIDEDIITPIERLATARLSDDLTLKKHRCDVDALIASGISAMRSLGNENAIVRLQTSMDVTAWAGAVEHANNIARRLNHENKWRLEDVQLQSLARSALKFFLVPTCPACKGRQFEEVKGTGRLGTRLCRTCNGSGEKSFARGQEVFLKAIVATLENDASDVNSIIRKVMR